MTLPLKNDTVATTNDIHQYYKHCITITTLPSGASDANNGIIKTYCISKNNQTYTQYADFSSLLVYQPVIYTNYRSGYLSLYEYGYGMITYASINTSEIFGTHASNSSNAMPTNYSTIGHSQILILIFIKITDRIIEL